MASPPLVTNPIAPSNSSAEDLSAREQRLRDLMVKAQAGDETAYRTLLVELSGRLRLFYRARLKSLSDEVEDLVQETLLAIHNQRHTYVAALPLTVWVHAIARYKLVDMFRRRGRKDAFTDQLDDASELLAAQEPEASDAHRDLGQLLDLLPEQQRQAIVHVKIRGYSVEETARLTGMSMSAVKVNVHRGLKALAKKVRDWS